MSFGQPFMVMMMKQIQYWVLQVKTLRNLPGKPAGSLGPNCPTAIVFVLYLYLPNCPVTIVFVFWFLFDFPIGTVQCTYPSIALLFLINFLSFYIIIFYQYLLICYHFIILFYTSSLQCLIYLGWYALCVHLESSHCVSDARKPHCVPGSGWLWGARERDFFRNHKMDLFRKLKWICIYPSHKGHHWVRAEEDWGKQKCSFT